MKEVAKASNENAYRGDDGTDEIVEDHGESKSDPVFSFHVYIIPSMRVKVKQKP